MPGLDHSLHKPEATAHFHLELENRTKRNHPFAVKIFTVLIIPSLGIVSIVPRISAPLISWRVIAEREFSEENQQVAMKRERQLLFFIHLLFASSHQFSTTTVTFS
jgi:hypothetical protein